MVFSNTLFALKTDESFEPRRYLSSHRPSHHNKKSELENIGIGMVSQIPIDPMHLIDLGVVRKMLLSLVNSKSAKNVKMVNQISNFLIEYKSHNPAEFQRSPRSLSEVLHWKATEFRQFLLYTGIMCLKNVVSDDIYNHFLLLHCSVRLLSQIELPLENIQLAEELLSNYVEGYLLIYGESKVSY